MKSANELFDQVLKGTTDAIYVMNPCKVVNVHGNFVDVLLYINDEEVDGIIYNVPIIRQETQSAYIFLGIKEGDRGTCRFFDRSVEGYLQSDFDYNSDDRQHDINDRCFELGFIPDNEAYVYPTNKEIEIGLKSTTFKLSVDSSGNLVITGATNVINGGTTINGDLIVNGKITATGEITGNNIALSTHTHTGNLGSPTSPPNA